MAIMDRSARMLVLAALTSLSLTLRVPAADSPVPTAPLDPGTPTDDLPEAIDISDLSEAPPVETPTPQGNPSPQSASADAPTAPITPEPLPPGIDASKVTPALVEPSSAPELTPPPPPGTAPAAVTAESAPTDQKAEDTPNVDNELPSVEDPPVAAEVAPSVPIETEPSEPSREESEQAKISPPESEEATSRAAAEIRQPAFTRMRPAWGVQLGGSMNAFGPESRFNSKASKSFRAAELTFEWQPQALQSIGVFSLGAVFRGYPELPKQEHTPAQLSFWSVGALARYQARYWIEQPIVPVASVSYEYLNYAVSGSSGRTPLMTSSLGGMLLLNTLEPSGAAAFYANYEVQRTYLLAELRKASQVAGKVKIAGTTYFFGVRFEF